MPTSNVANRIDYGSGLGVLPGHYQGLQQIGSDTLYQMIANPWTVPGDPEMQKKIKENLDAYMGDPWTAGAFNQRQAQAQSAIGQQVNQARKNLVAGRPGLTWGATPKYLESQNRMIDIMGSGAVSNALTQNLIAADQLRQSAIPMAQNFENTIAGRQEAAAQRRQQDISTALNYRPLEVAREAVTQNPADWIGPLIAGIGSLVPGLLDKIWGGGKDDEDPNKPAPTGGGGGPVVFPPVFVPDIHTDPGPLPPVGNTPQVGTVFNPDPAVVIKGPVGGQVPLGIPGEVITPPSAIVPGVSTTIPGLDAAIASSGTGVGTAIGVGGAMPAPPSAIVPGVSTTIPNFDEAMAASGAGSGVPGPPGGIGSAITSNLMSLAPYMPIIGTFIGLAHQNRPGSTASGALAGAGIGGMIGGPIGMGIGAAAGGLLGFFGAANKDEFNSKVANEMTTAAGQILAGMDAGKINPEDAEGMLFRIWQGAGEAWDANDSSNWKKGQNKYFSEWLNKVQANPNYGVKTMAGRRVKYVGNDDSGNHQWMDVDSGQILTPDEFAALNQQFMAEANAGRPEYNPPSYEDVPLEP